MRRSSIYEAGFSFYELNFQSTVQNYIQALISNMESNKSFQFKKWSCCLNSQICYSKSKVSPNSCLVSVALQVSLQLLSLINSISCRKFPLMEIIYSNSLYTPQNQSCSTLNPCWDPDTLCIFSTPVTRFPINISVLYLIQLKLTTSTLQERQIILYYELVSR